MTGGTDSLDRSAGAVSTGQDAAGQGSRAGPPAAPSEGPAPERKAAELRNDAAEEERRQKLRQVGIAAVNVEEIVRQLIQVEPWQPLKQSCAALSCHASLPVQCKKDMLLPAVNHLGDHSLPTTASCIIQTCPLSRWFDRWS